MRLLKAARATVSGIGRSAQPVVIRRDLLMTRENQNGPQLSLGRRWWGEWRPDRPRTRHPSEGWDPFWLCAQSIRCRRRM